MADPVSQVQSLQQIEAQIDTQTDSLPQVNNADVQRFDNAMNGTKNELPPVFRLENDANVNRLQDSIAAKLTGPADDLQRAMPGEQISKVFSNIVKDYDKLMGFVNKNLKTDSSNDLTKGVIDAEVKSSNVNSIDNNIVSSPINNGNGEVSGQATMQDLKESYQNSFDALRKAQDASTQKNYEISMKTNQVMLATANLSLFSAGLTKATGAFSTLMKNQ